MNKYKIGEVFEDIPDECVDVCIENTRYLLDVDSKIHVTKIYNEDGLPWISIEIRGSLVSEYKCEK